jgi:hypothetical protein
LRHRLSLTPWIRTRYGIDRVHTILLSGSKWRALVAGEMAAPQLKAFKDELALAQLSHPEALIVVGGGGGEGGEGGEASRRQRPQARWELETIVRHLRGLGLPMEFIAVWVSEHWGQDDCLIESEELQVPPYPAGRRHSSDAEEELYAGLTSD